MDSKEIVRELQPKTCELELELILYHMTQKPMLRGEHARELWPFKDGLCGDLDGKASLIVVRRAPLSLPYWRWFSFLPLRGDKRERVLGIRGVLEFERDPGTVGHFHRPLSTGTGLLALASSEQTVLGGWV